MNESKHTPGPWSNQCFAIYAATGEQICHTGFGQLPPPRSAEAEANAAHIVRCVNAHDDLLSHAKESIAFLNVLLELTSARGILLSSIPEMQPFKGIGERAIKAIAKAKGK